jgi:hypothetical protein
VVNQSDLSGEPSPAQEHPPAEPPRTDPAPLLAGESLTDGGYAYSVVDDTPADEQPVERLRRGLNPGALAMVAAAVVGVFLVGGLVWLLVSWRGGDGDDSGRVNSDVSSVLNAFARNQEGAEVRRFVGELPPGFPDGVPAYPDARVVASIAQISGADAAFLAVYDTEDGREDVAAFFAERFDSDPWQIDAGQSGADVTLHQFSRIDDADVSGVVLSSESPDNDLTTILISVQVVSGAEAAGEATFEPRVTQPLPSGFPAEFPQYPDAIVIESAFQREPRGDSYAVSFVTRDGIDDVLQFFRDEFDDRGWSVQDIDASQSPLPDGEAISFEAEDSAISGGISAGEFAEDDDYTRVELQVLSTE